MHRHKDTNHTTPHTTHHARPASRVLTAGAGPARCRARRTAHSQSCWAGSPGSWPPCPPPCAPRARAVCPAPAWQPRCVQAGAEWLRWGPGSRRRGGRGARRWLPLLPRPLPLPPAAARPAAAAGGCPAAGPGWNHLQLAVTALLRLQLCFLLWGLLLQHSLRCVHSVRLHAGQPKALRQPLHRGCLGVRAVKGDDLFST